MGLSNDSTVPILGCPFFLSMSTVLESSYDKKSFIFWLPDLHIFFDSCRVYGFCENTGSVGRTPDRYKAIAMVLFCFSLSPLRHG